MASASVLYQNGSIGTSLLGPSLNGTVRVADSFTLSSDSTVTGVNFEAWLLPYTSSYSLTWLIVPTNPDWVNSGTAATVTSVDAGTSVSGWELTEGSFSTGSVSLSSGTYYLELFAASGTVNVLWDQSSGPSTAYAGSGNSISSEYFQILGDAATSNTPLPATLPLFASGLGALGLLGWRRKRKAQAA